MIGRRAARKRGAGLGACQSRAATSSSEAERDSRTALPAAIVTTAASSISVNPDSSTGMPQSSVALAISLGLRPRRRVSAS
jgi:hypothetical protein